MLYVTYLGSKQWKTRTKTKLKSKSNSMQFPMNERPLMQCNAFNFLKIQFQVLLDVGHLGSSDLNTLNTDDIVRGNDSFRINAPGEQLAVILAFRSARVEVCSGANLAWRIVGECIACAKFDVSYYNFTMEMEWKVNESTHIAQAKMLLTALSVTSPPSVVNAMSHCKP
jgi:hypothetical protein